MAAVEFDRGLREPLSSLLTACETNCVAGCCGLDAFDFTLQPILDWVLEQSSTDMWLAFEILAELIGDVKMSTDTIVSDRLNAWWKSPTEATTFLRQIQKDFRNAVEIQLGRRLIDDRWISDNVTALASSISDFQVLDRLPILADAMEEAGCDDSFILVHLRSEVSHKSGCWVVDEILHRQ
jgi:hypothetical protein